jgi:hypothetical protein
MVVPFILQVTVSSITSLLSHTASSPYYQRRSITAKILDSSTYLYWPAPHFQSEYLFLGSKSRWIDISQRQAREKTTEAPVVRGEEKEERSEREPRSQEKGRSYSWRVGVIADCSVGICCTEHSSVDDSPNKNALLRCPVLPSHSLTDSSCRSRKASELSARYAFSLTD